MDDDAIAETVAQILARTVPTLVAQVVAELTAQPPAEPTPADEHEAANTRSVLDALAEKARWDAMPPDELAAAEAEAARTRYADALVDVLERDGDVSLVAELAEGLSDAEVRNCRNAAKERLSGNRAALAVIAGLK